MTDLDELARLNVATIRALCPAETASAVDVAKAATEAEIEPGVAAVTVLKTAGDSRVSWGIAYPVLRADIAVAADGHRDFADRDAVEKAAWDFLAAGRQIGIEHTDGTVGHGTVVESYLHRGKPLIVKAVDGSTQTVHPGDWCLSVRWDEPTWPLVKSGRLGGYSPQGAGQRSAVTPERLAQLRS